MNPQVNLNLQSILCAACLLRNANTKCMASYISTDAFKCLGWGAMVGAGTRISTKGEICHVVWCGPYKVLEVLNRGENVKLTIPAPFNRLRVFNRISIKPYIHGEGQQLWDFLMPAVKTGASP